MTKHGEYKVPGGKLVVADFVVVAGRLAEVRISGDFFLFPDDAIHILAASLNDALISESVADLALRVGTALGTDVEMLGFSAEDVAIAIHRGLA